jgi:hypothetical protein
LAGYGIARLPRPRRRNPLQHVVIWRRPRAGVAQLVQPIGFSLVWKPHEIPSPTARHSGAAIHWCRGIRDAQAARCRRPPSRSRGELATSLAYLERSRADMILI